MEFYPHQQQPHTTQQVDDGSLSGPATNTNTINSNNSNININNVRSTNITPPTSNTISSAAAAVPVDAATVAIAKDMLQLHHGSGTALTNNNNNNSNNTSNSSNNNHNNSSALEAMNTTSSSNANTNSVGAAAGSSSTTNSGVGGANDGSISAPTTLVTNHPPANASDGNSNTTNSGGSGTDVSTAPDNALGFLKYDQELLYILEPITIIGRNSSTSHVHFHVAENNLVSRKHFQVLYDGNARDFFVQCLSKNGIFVDDFLQRRNADPLRLPNSCYFRFPSTEIRIQFESFVRGSTSSADALNSSTSSGTSVPYHNNSHQNIAVLHNSTGVSGGGGGGPAQFIISPAPPDDHHHHPHAVTGSSAHASTHGSHHQQHHVSSNAVSSSTHLLPHMDNSNVYSPLKISIPKKEQKSPYLSPTGTISAANSCPASPRQGFHQNQANYNNYSNNNLQNQDLFQTPSTASYNHNEKPPYSYAQLIVQAISAAPDKQLTLSGIYSFIVKHYPYYRKETNKGWQNSIRHNLSLNRYFIKVARSQDEPGKGSFWRIDPDSGAKLIDHSYKKRRQRSSQGFRPSYGMPRSAPVSPSHMDNSRESSPLQDFVLQSAPGSPGMSIEQRAADGDLMYNNTTQNMHHSTANNSHNQYNSSGSPYYVSNQNSAITGGQQHQQQQQLHNESGAGNIGNSSGNGVGALIALKRNHAMAAGAQQQQQQQQQVQTLHPDIIYEEMPTDYSGNMESGDECGSIGGGGGSSGNGGGSSDAAKRPKYISEVL
ncbi:fork head transcription factor 1 isoform X2 [Rhagoletis pomonella]|uniref:fork head transcription factor 1 isoform X2 n=1 Tax=Rhagoletis pomonella TaxID=28610 RepID=UPI00177BC569|nr:fork head transcription factor 1 isoform X2 [Rhagoletis pomonella]